MATRQGEELTPLVYVEGNKYYIELKCERRTCAIIAFELLLSAKHAFVSNYTGLGNRQAPS